MQKNSSQKNLRRSTIPPLLATLQPSTPPASSSNPLKNPSTPSTPAGPNSKLSSPSSLPGFVASEEKTGRPATAYAISCSPMSKEPPFIAGLRLISLLLLSVLVLFLPFVVRADTITGTVKDPSGGVVPGARIEITGDGITQPILLTTDEFGKFAALDLKPGQYSVRVTKDGFEPLVSAIELHGTTDLQLQLVIAGQITSVTITEKSLAFANSDSVYRQLRGIGFGDSYVCGNYKFNMDVGSFELKTGTLTFLAPVNGIVTGAIFVGEGHFTLKPIARIDIDEMQRRSGSPTAEEDFSRAVFRFTGRIYNQITASLVTKVATPPTAEEAFRHWKEKIRRRREVPVGFTAAILTDATIDNLNADVLGAVYNPKPHQFFI